MLSRTAIPAGVLSMAGVGICVLMTVIAVLGVVDVRRRVGPLPVLAEDTLPEEKDCQGYPKTNRQELHPESDT
jgi:hypothetical protein